MRDWTTVRERYLRDELSVRLGGLAANLARIESFSGQEGDIDVVESLLDESKFFIEWTAADADIDTAAELIELQLQLAGWQRRWRSICRDRAQMLRIAEAARVWSDRVLDIAGLGR